MARVVYDHVNKRFGDILAVDDFCLEISDQEFLVLVGPSGCGKSTVLRLLAGLEEITDGDIYIGDRLVNKVAAKDRDIAMVFQSYALFPHMSVYDNLAFGLTLRKTPRQEIGQRVAAAAEILGIEELLDRKPRQLSGGQRQRVALGRAIVREPSVFLLDEPLSNLDAKLRVQTRAEIVKLHQRLGTTFIYVTHDQVEAMTMATQIAVINNGALQQVGKPQELYDKPINMFVAGFIGSPAMNFFDVRLRADGDRIYADSGTFQMLMTHDLAGQLRPYIDQNVVFGIRPENIHDRDYQPSGITGAPFTAVVDVTEPMGNEVFLYLKNGDKQFVARVDPRTRARPNSKVELVLDVDQIHVFDPKTELDISA
ncbi:MAG: sn-glycerol-3-phosphate ABC transporter ATP-binding protein UgpC [Chloroflexi bacterium]|nr:sn-glycerol-3-phosphate ABC transporter ATP-binding protein UgpC [Chloroflexota bacterium]